MSNIHGENMDLNIQSIVLTVVLVSMLLIIGAGITTVTNESVKDAVGNETDTTLLDDVSNAGSNALKLTGNMLSIIVIVLIGFGAIYYVTRMSGGI